MFQKTSRQHDKRHLAFIHRLPCVLTGSQMPVEAIHLRSSCLPLGKRHTGGQEKPSDKYTLPMLPELHRVQHSMNEVKFWEAYGWKWPRVVQLALDLHEHSGDEETCKKLIERARR